MDVFSIEYALLATQNALLREVTPQLRAVFVDLDHKEDLLHISFYYDGEATEKTLDSWDCVISEASTDLGPEYLLKATIERLDYPKKIPVSGYCAFLRKEPEALHNKDILYSQVEITQKSFGYALLAVQHAVLGVVTPELRAVVVDFEKEKPLLYIRFYYDTDVPQNLIELWHASIHEASRNFGTVCLLDSGVERVDYPKEIPFRGRYAYFRKEQL
jgi:hypothetical protein